MSFEANMLAVSGSTSAAVLALWDQFLAGLISLEEFHESAALVIDAGRMQGAVIGALTVAAYVEVLTGAGVDVQAPRLPSVIPKLLAALATITAGLGDGTTAPATVPTRAKRVAEAEVQAAAQDGMQDAIEDTPELEGWTRQLDGGACGFCRDLKADENQTMPKGSKMARHEKCACTPLPVVKTAVIVAKHSSVYRRGVGWMTREQAEVWDVTGEIPPLDSLPPRQFVPAGSLTDAELAAFPSPKRRK